MLNEFKQWLQSQLTSTKQNEAAWVDLAGAIAESIHNHVNGYLERIQARNSLYDMSIEDLKRESSELRKIFPIEGVEDEDLPHVVMQRRDEIHFKKTVYPMVATLAREFSGMGVEWQPLYAPKDQDQFPYGSVFAVEDELNDFAGLTPDDFFLTSRGTIRVPVNKVSGGEEGIDDEALLAFEGRVRRVIYPLIPLRIVCEGYVYYAEFTMAEFIEWMEYEDFVSTHLATTADAEDGPTEKSKDTVETDLAMTDQVLVDPIYSTSRLDAIPIDGITMDYTFN